MIYLGRFLLSSLGVACLFGLFMNVWAKEPVQSVEKVVLNDRVTLYEALVKQNVFNQHRKLIKFSHLCTLVIENERYPVVDIVEHVKGAQVPRSALQVVVLDASLKVVNKISYHTAVPLYCHKNQLLWSGLQMIDNLYPEGNVFTFSDKAKKVAVSEMNPNNLPNQNRPQ